jgi:hypothetical protein
VTNDLTNVFFCRSQRLVRNQPPVMGRPNLTSPLTAASRVTPAGRSTEYIATDKNFITFIFEDVFPPYIYRRKLRNSI